MIDLSDSGVLGTCHGDSRMDLATYILRVSVVDPAVTYHELSVHEESHWVRFHGSTVGIALCFMKYAAERLIADYLLALPQQEKAELVRIRRTGSKIFNLDGMHESASDDFELIRQLWVDLRVTYRMLLNSTGMEDTSWDGRAAVGSAFTDVTFWATRIFLGKDSTTRMELGPPPMTPLIIDGEHITTRLLFECVAAIDQCLSFGVNFRGPRVRESSAALSALDGVYGGPLRLFRKITGRPQTQYPYRQDLRTVAALCDFALNPLVPPFLPSGVDRLNWNEIYPPIRFACACAAVNEIGLLGDDKTSDADLKRYIKLLARWTGLPNPHRYRGVFLGGQQRMGLKTTFSFPEPIKLGTYENDYIVYLAWVQSKLWSLRRAYPTLLTFYGANWTSQAKAAARYRRREGDGWFVPPFRWSDNDRAESRGVDKHVGVRYAASIAGWLTLHDLVSRTGRFRLDFLPPADAGLDHLDATIKSEIESMMGTTVYDQSIDDPTPTDVSARFHDSADLFDALPLTETVMNAFQLAVVESGPDVILNTKTVLLALSRADACGDWSRIWLHRYPEALGDDSSDDPDADVGGRWEGTPVTATCASAFQIAARLSRTYELGPVSVGALALGLLADPRSAASVALGVTNREEHSQLVELVQSELLGCILDGLDI